MGGVGVGESESEREGGREGGRVCVCVRESKCGRTRERGERARARERTTERASDKGLETRA